MLEFGLVGQVVPPPPPISNLSLNKGEKSYPDHSESFLPDSADYEGTEPGSGLLRQEYINDLTPEIISTIMNQASLSLSFFPLKILGLLETGPKFVMIQEKVPLCPQPHTLLD